LTCIIAEWNRVITAVKDISIYTVPIYQQQFGGALARRPRLNLIRFRGVLAPNAKLRCEIIPSPPQPATEPSTDHAPAPGAARPAQRLDLFQTACEPTPIANASRRCCWF